MKGKRSRMARTIPTPLTHLIISCRLALASSSGRRIKLVDRPLANRIFFHSKHRIPVSSMSCAAASNPPTTTSSTPPTKTVRVMIKGRVQGVFYRNWTVENARGLGLKGWVRNRRDGSVEALFSGDPDSVHEMEQRCRRGPRDAVVTGFQVFPCEQDPPAQGFDQKPTV